MQIKRLLFCLGTVVAPFSVAAQGTFQNLDFEQAVEVPTYPGSPFLWAAEALPGWTPYVGGVPQTEVERNSVLLGGVGLADPAGSFNVLDGSFSALLGGPGLSAVPISIGQSGTIPAGSESVRFLASAPLLVSFAGHPIPITFLGPGKLNGLLYGGDISAYAGQYGQLLFQTYVLSSEGLNPLDDISFSTHAVPEPGVLTILGLGGLMLCLRRRRRRAVARWLGPMAFGNPAGLLSRKDGAKIAQRDNAGMGRFCVSPVAKGRLSAPSEERVILRAAFGRPFGTWGRLAAKPSVETLGYSRMCLRDQGRRPGQGNFRKALRLGAAWAGRLLGLLLLLTLPAAVEAQFDYTTNNGAIDITRYTGPGGALTIPSAINGLPVTTLDAWAFAQTGLTSVTIPDTVTSLGYEAFASNYSLGEVAIGSGVTNMGYGAFEYCFRMTNLAIADGVTSIGDLAFFSCSGLASVTIPDSVTGIGNGAFYGCGGLSSVKIGSGVTGIGDDAFSGCASLTGVTLGTNLIGIGADSFFECPLTSLTLPNSLASIGENAFGGSGFTSVTIPNSVTNLGARAFQGCSSLTNVTIGNGVASIGEQAFDHSGLTSVAIPNRVASIGDDAFNACFGLSSAAVGNGVTNIGEGAFYQCSSLASVALGTNVATIGDSAFAESGLLSLAIPGSVASIGAGAFGSCTGLTGVTIPSSVTSIGHGAFYGCAGLAAITVDANNPAYSSVGGVLFDRGQTRLIQYPAGNAATSYAIPAGVTSIADGAFAFCAGLSAITVNASNTAYRSVGGALFDRGQTTLIAYPAGNAATSYALPAGVTSIGDYAFAACRSLASVTIPNSVASIGQSAFYGCSGLAGVTIPGSVTNLGDSAFHNCAGLASVTIAGGVTNLGDSAFYFCPSLISVYFEGNAPALGAYSYVFFGDEAATIYYLPGTTGWAGFAANTGLAPVLWNPQVQTTGGGFGVRTNQFGFTASGTAGLVVVVEASTSLAKPAWQPLGTNTLNGGSFHFSDPQWTNYPARFYRLRMP